MSYICIHNFQHTEVDMEPHYKLFTTIIQHLAIRNSQKHLVFRNSDMQQPRVLANPLLHPTLGHMQQPQIITEV